MIVKKNSLNIWTVIHFSINRKFFISSVFFLSVGCCFSNERKKNAFHRAKKKKKFECDQMIKWIFVMSVSQCYLLNPNTVRHTVVILFFLTSLPHLISFYLQVFGCQRMICICARFSSEFLFVYFFCYCHRCSLIKVYCRVILKTCTQNH